MSCDLNHERCHHLMALSKIALLSGFGLYASGSHFHLLQDVAQPSQWKAQASCAKLKL